TLLAMREAVPAGESLDAIESNAAARLASAGFAVDYAVIHRADLGVAATDQRTNLVALIAARLGATRLIDNIAID
ncbi:MAG: pantoate--beta-alanine ligase, partial [Lysobacteraceae bacterium]